MDWRVIFSCPYCDNHGCSQCPEKREYDSREEAVIYKHDFLCLHPEYKVEIVREKNNLPPVYKALGS